MNAILGIQKSQGLLDFVDFMDGNDGSEKVGQEQVHELLFSDKLSWQAIIYDLINTEQLDPWDIDIGILTQKYLERVKDLEEVDFFISSKVLFAASLLLRIKSEIVLNKDIPGLDDILFGKKEEVKSGQERLELDEGELPSLVPRTPLPRLRKVTLDELLASLGKAIGTETRRIRKEILIMRQERETGIMIARSTFNLRDKIRGIYGKLKRIFSEREDRLAFSELLNMSKDDKVEAFVTLLHLDTQQRVWLEQDAHFDEIWILLRHLYEKRDKVELKRLREEVEKLQAEHEAEVGIEEQLDGEED